MQQTIEPNVHSDPAVDLRISVARSAADLLAVDSLWREVYGREMGWLNPDAGAPVYLDRYHRHSTYLLATLGGRAAGTMRIVDDSELGLPVEQFVDFGKKSLQRVIECQRLMVLSEYRKVRDDRFCPFGVFAALVKAALQYSVRRRVTHVVADLFVDTDTTPMRQLQRLGFKQVGRTFTDFELSERSQSVALVLELSDLIADVFLEQNTLHRYLITRDERVSCDPKLQEVG